MSRMDEDGPAESNGLCKALIIGDGKIGKTWWAGQAAKDGFNLLYIDGDVGRPTLQQLDISARRRIYHMDVRDTLAGGVKDYRFLESMIEFTTSITFKWNDTQGRVAKKSDPATDTIWEIKPGQMDHNAVLVLDSWTGLTESMMTAGAQVNGVDLANATTPEMRPVYQSAGLKASQILQCIRSIRCHVIVIAHPDEYSHTIKPTGRKVSDIKESELIIDWTKLIPKSTSRPQALSMAKYFTDILWAESNATGSERLINARLDPNKISGGHWTDRKKFEEYSFANLVRHLGGTVPTETPDMSGWFRVVEPGEREAAAAEPKKILDGTTPSQMEGQSIKGLFAKKA